jgi:hypothetical protein
MIDTYSPWKHVFKIASMAFLVQYATNDFGNYNVRESRAPVDITLGTYEVRGVSGVSAIHAALLPNGNIYLISRIKDSRDGNYGDQGLV